MADFLIRTRPELPADPVAGENWVEALRAWLVARGRPASTREFRFDILADGAVVATDPMVGQAYHIAPAPRPRPRLSTAPPPVPSDTLDDPFHDGEDDARAAVTPSRRRPRSPALGGDLEQLTAHFGALDPLAASARLLDACLASVPSAAGSVFLIDPRDRALYFAAVRGPEAEALRHRRLPLEVGIVGASIRARRSINLQEPAEDPRFARGVATAVGRIPRSLICAPLLSGRRVFGAVELLDRLGAVSYSEAEETRIRRAARRLADHLASLDP